MTRSERQWTVRPWTDPLSGDPGAEIYDQADGTTYRVAVKPGTATTVSKMTALYVNPGSESEVDWRYLRVVPAAALRDFALDHVRRQEKQDDS